MHSLLWPRLPFRIRSALALRVPHPGNSEEQWSWPPFSRPKPFLQLPPSVVSERPLSSPCSPQGAHPLPPARFQPREFSSFYPPVILIRALPDTSILVTHFILVKRRWWSVCRHHYLPMRIYLTFSTKVFSLHSFFLFSFLSSFDAFSFSCASLSSCSIFCRSFSTVPLSSIILLNSS